MRARSSTSRKSALACRTVSAIKFYGYWKLETSFWHPVTVPWARSAPGTERPHVGTAHRKVLDFGYLEASHVSQFLIPNHPLRHVRA